MKKILAFLCMILIISNLWPSPTAKNKPETIRVFRTFEGAGMIVPLNAFFYDSDIVDFEFAAQSTEIILMGNRYSKFDYLDLDDFVNSKISSVNHTQIIEREGKDYVYCYYTYTEQEIDFGYMFMAKESQSSYYIMIFRCNNDKLDENKSQYLAWADAIIFE